MRWKSISFDLLILIVGFLCIFASNDAGLNIGGLFLVAIVVLSFRSTFRPGRQEAIERPLSSATQRDSPPLRAPGYVPVFRDRAEPGTKCADCGVEIDVAGFSFYYLDSGQRRFFCTGCRDRRIVAKRRWSVAAGAFEDLTDAKPKETDT